MLYGVCKDQDYTINALSTSRSWRQALTALCKREPPCQRPVTVYSHIGARPQTLAQEAYELRVYGRCLLRNRCIAQVQARTTRRVRAYLAHDDPECRSLIAYVCLHARP